MLRIVNYRLHKPNKDYSALYAALENVSSTYWHNTTSSWLIETDLTPEQIYNNLSSHVDVDDELVVFTVKSDWFGQLKPDDLKWLQARQC